MNGTGYYVATLLAGSRRRYRRRGLFARGNGEWEIGDEAFSYRRYLTRHRIVIPYSAIGDVVLGGSWFGGRWLAGNKVVRVTWDDGGTAVESGFVFSGKPLENQRVAEELRLRSRKTPE